VVVPPGYYLLVNKRSLKLVMVINGLVRLLGKEKVKQQQLDEERLPKQKDPTFCFSAECIKASTFFISFTCSSWFW
jgi:hypothetical protein